MKVVVEVRQARRVASGAKRNVTPTKLQHIIPKPPPHRRSYEEGNRRARRQTATHRDGLADIAGDGNAYQIVAVDRPIRQVVCNPAGARKVDVASLLAECS
jgi:hypothetical protein